MKPKSLLMTFFGRAAVVVLLLLPGRLLAACEPGANEAAIFQDRDFKGRCKVLTPRNYPDSGALGLSNDSVSSIKVGASAQIEVCQDSFYEGRCMVLTSDAASLRGQTVGNDSISSAKVQPRGSSTRCEPAPEQVAFFQLKNFGGACEVRGVGRYQNSREIGLGNDHISSIKIGTEVKLILYEDAGFARSAELFLDTDSDLHNNRIGEKTSSAVVERRDATSCEPGAGQASFYEHADFVEPCVTLDIGNYESADAFRLRNDSISAVKLGMGTQAVVCTDNNFLKNCERLTGDDPSLANNRVIKVSSLKVQHLGFQECAPEAGEASLFLHRDFLAPCRRLGPGDYKNSSRMRIRDDAVTSVLVGRDAQACLCDRPGFLGTCERFTRDEPNLNDPTSRRTLANDSVSSARIGAPGDECRSQSGNEPGASFGYNELRIWNCSTDRRAIEVWLADLTLGLPWKKVAGVAYHGSNGFCPATGEPESVKLEDGHWYTVYFVDPSRPGCNVSDIPVDPDCRRFELFRVHGWSSGSFLPLSVP